MSRERRGASASSSSSVTTTNFPLLVSYPRSMSSPERTSPSFGQTYWRASGVPSGPSMRSETGRRRVAEKSCTGTVTRPKLMLPDQMERPCARLRSSGNFPLLRCLQTLAERAAQIARHFRGRRFLESDRLALRLGGDQLAHASTVIVVEDLGIERSVERGDELLRELPLELL